MTAPPSSPHSGIPAALADLAVPVGDLRPYAGNARSGNVDVIAESLATHGQYRAIVVRRSTGEVLAGNHTLLAARRLGWSHVAATYVDCDDEQARRIVLVDNRSSDLATYDDSALVALLESLDGDLSGTGFTDVDLAELLGGMDGDAPAELTPRDDAPARPEPAEAITEPGQVWALGPHRMLVGDGTDVDAVRAALDGQVPDAVWTDPPYGVDYVGKTADAMTIKADGAAGLPALLEGLFRCAVAVCRPGAPVYIAHPPGPQHVYFDEAAEASGILVRQQLVWVKNALVLGRSDYHYKHEAILAGTMPGEPDDPDHYQDADHQPLLYGFTPRGKGRLGRGGPQWFGDHKQTTVFECPKPTASRVHPTMKPVALILRHLSNSLRPGGLVLDLCGGSGSTLIAAHHHRSRAFVAELDPPYADVIARRYQEHTGVVPIELGSGRQVSFVAGA